MAIAPSSTTTTGARGCGCVPHTSNDKLYGLMLGTAVGDALGLPMEGLKPQQIKALGWNKTGSTLPWQHRLVLGRGMLSDDTEHAIFVAQCLLRCHNDVDKFRRCLAWQLRLWFLALPPGVGLATARAIIKLWLGIPSTSSGVYSAGNGPAMRAAVIGAVYYKDSDTLTAMLTASTRLTHTDPRALTGALAVAIGAAYAMESTTTDPSVEGGVGASSTANVELLLTRWRNLAPEDKEWQTAMTKMAMCLVAGDSVATFAGNLGLAKGVSGYIYHTVPVALYAWLRHYGEFITTTSSVLALGGDTDTVAAITCALAGLTGGTAGIPQEWLDGIIDWPRSITFLRKIASGIAILVANQSNLTTNQSTPYHRTPIYFYVAIPIRNLLLLLVVIFHGVCRYLPMLINPLRAKY